MIITITGKAGSGKSTVAKLVAKKLGFKHYSSGDFMREIAKEKNISLIDLSKLAEKETWLDKEIDERQIKIGKTEDNFIIDGRLSWHFIPKSVKVYLDVKDEIAVKRIYSDIKNREEEGLKDFNDLVKKTKDRVESEKKRYKQYYNLDLHDKKNYDLVIDTSEINANEVAEKIIKFSKSQE